MTGVQETVYVFGALALVTVPRATGVAPLKLTKNCTLVIEPSVSEVVAVIVLLAPTPEVLVLLTKRGAWGVSEKGRTGVRTPYRVAKES